LKITNISQHSVLKTQVEALTKVEQLFAEESMQVIVSAHCVTVTYRLTDRQSADRA